MVKYIEQRKKIAKFEKYVREHEIESVGVMRKVKEPPRGEALGTVVEEEELEAVAAMPRHTEHEALYTSMDTEDRAIEDM
jgi:hypothetical protein